jgi:hypothetical protein
LVVVLTFAAGGATALQAAVLSGTVNDPGGQPLAGVALGLSGGLPGTLTDGQGRWQVVASVADGTTVTVTPALAGAGFTPAQRMVVVSDGAARADFVGQPLLGVAASLAATRLSLAPATVNAGQFTPMLKLRVQAVGAAAVITGLRVRDIGTAPAAGLSVRVVIGGRVKSVSTSYESASKTWTLTFTAPTSLTSGGYIYYELQINPPASSSGNTVQLSVPDAGAVLSTTPATGAFPLSSTAATVTANPFLAISGYSLAPATVLPDTWTSLYKAVIKATNGAATLSGLRWRDMGTAPAAALTGRVLFGGQPVAGNTTFDAGTRTWTHTFTTPKALASGATAYYDLQESATAAANGRTIQAQLADGNAVVANVPGAGDLPLSSSAATVAPAVYVSVTGSNLAPGQANTGSWTSMYKVRLAATGGAATVTGLRLQDAGTVLPAAINAALYISGQEVPATVQFDAATRTWEWRFVTARRISAGAYLWIEVAMAASDAAIGQTSRAVLGENAVLADVPALGAWPLQSSAATWWPALISSTLVGTVDRATATAIRNLSYTGLPDAQYDTRYYKLTYRTLDPHRQVTTATGMLGVPVGATNPPVVSLQHGTVTERTDVPSRYTTGDNHSVLFTGSGYLMVAADYLGLGDGPGRHPYLHRDSEAVACGDMLRAARSFCAQNQIPWGNRLFLAGYSQGGHATLALQQMLETGWASLFPVTASAPMAGPYDLSNVTVDAALTSPGVYSTLYVAYLLTAYNGVYGTGSVYTTPSEVFNAPWAGIVEGLFDGTHAFLDIAQALPATPAQLVRADWLADFQANPNHRLRSLLVSNDVYGWRPLAPVRFFHGAADTEVPYANATVAVTRMLGLGATAVSLVTLPGTGHSDGVCPSLQGAHDWFQTLR